MNTQIPEEQFQYLEQIATLVAGLAQLEQERTKIGEPPDENRQALLVLGEAYMYLYNFVLDNYNNNGDTDDWEDGD